MKDLTPQQHRDIDKRVCEVLRQLVPDADPGTFAGHAAMLSGFVRGEIREALHNLAAAQPAPPRKSERERIRDFYCNKAAREAGEPEPFPAPQPAPTETRTLTRAELRANADAAWCAGYDAHREGRQRHSPYAPQSAPTETAPSQHTHYSGNACLWCQGTHKHTVPDGCTSPELAAPTETEPYVPAVGDRVRDVTVGTVVRISPRLGPIVKFDGQPIETACEPETLSPVDPHQAHALANPPGPRGAVPGATTIMFDGSEVMGTPVRGEPQGAAFTFADPTAPHGPGCKCRVCVTCDWSEEQANGALESDTCELCGYVVTEATPRGSLLLGGKVVCTECYADPSASKGSK